MENKFESDQCNLSNYQKIRKLIPVDFDLELDEYEEYKEIDHADTVLENSNIVEDLKTYKSIIKQTKNECKGKMDNSYLSRPWTNIEGLRLTQHEYHRFCDIQLESYDLATQCPTRKVSDRKHKINKNILSLLTIDNYMTHSKVESYSDHLRDISSENIKSNLKQIQKLNFKVPESKIPVIKLKNDLDNIDSSSTMITSNVKSTYSSFGEMLLEDKFSLTLEEIVHIRSVLTKAELESLPVEGRVKEDVEKRRVCFLCLKTRFGLLGPWGQHCRLCQKTVCVKCYSKMKIPTEHFSKFPVMLLSPGLPISPSSADSNFEISKSSWSESSITIGSGPYSPATKRNTRKFFGSPSNLVNITQFGTSNRTKKSQEKNNEHVHGVLMVVCHDCRMMVIQIIKNSRITRATLRNNVISRLTLDILPVYV